MHQDKMRTKLSEQCFKFFCFNNSTFEAKVDVLLCTWNKLSESAWSDDFCLIFYILSRRQFFFISKLPFKLDTVLIYAFEVRQ